MTALLITFAVIVMTVFTTGMVISRVVVETNCSNAVEKTATVYYYLPESLIKITSTVKVVATYNTEQVMQSVQIAEQTFAITTEMIASTSHPLSLNYKPNLVMADEINFSVNDRGLLETVAITTDDRTPGIVSSITEYFTGKKIAAVASTPMITRINEFSAAFTMRAAELSSTAKPVNWKIMVTNEFTGNEHTEVLAGFDVTKNIAISANIPQTAQAVIPVIQTAIKGILTRPLCSIDLLFTSHNSLTSTSSATVIVADTSRLVVIPIVRTPFVKRVNKVSIKNGIVVGHEITNPSSVEGLVSIPINVIKSIISIPAQLISFKYDNTKRMNELATEELKLKQSNLSLAQFHAEKQSKMDETLLEARKAQMSNEMEISRHRLELQESLLKAEKSKLATGQDLEKLKKEIEELRKAMTPQSKA